MKSEMYYTVHSIGELFDYKTQARKRKLSENKSAIPHVSKYGMLGQTFETQVKISNIRRQQ